MVQRLGKLHNMVKDDDGREMKRHIDQLKPSHLKKGVIIFPSMQQEQSKQQEKKKVKVDQENVPSEIPKKKEIPQRSTRNKLPARYVDNYIIAVMYVTSHGLASIKSRHRRDFLQTPQ